MTADGEDVLHDCNFDAAAQTGACHTGFEVGWVLGVGIAGVCHVCFTVRFCMCCSLKSVSFSPIFLEPDAVSSQ